MHSAGTRTGYGPDLTTLVRALKVPGFTVLHYRHEGGTSLPPHEHERPAMVVQLSGAYAGTVGRDSYVCEAGDLAIVPAHLSHTETIGPTRADALLVFPESANQLPWTEKELSRTKRFRGSVFRRIARKLVRELHTVDGSAPLEIEAALLEVSSLIVQSRWRSEAGRLLWLERIRDYLDAHFSQPITLDRLARMAGVSRTYLARMFRQRYGCTVGRYLRAQRFQRANRLLAKSDQTLAEIALHCGFFDQSHFSNSFRLRFETTPSDYRRNAGLHGN